MQINNIYKGKKILVTGGSGMIGRELVAKLLDFGAQVRVASLDDVSRVPEGCEFIKTDLTNYSACETACQGMDFVFHLAGIKGSPLVCKTNPVDFFDNIILFSLNMLKAAHRAGAERYLFTSSIGVYAPSEIFHEDDVWKTFPSDHKTRWLFSDSPRRSTFRDRKFPSRNTHIFSY